MERINWQRTRDILLCIIAFGIILWALGNILNNFVETVIILLLAMAIAFLMSPVVDFLEKARIPRVFGALIAYVLVLGLIVLFGYELVLTLINQAQGFADQITRFATNLPVYLKNTIDFLLKQGIPQENIDDTVNTVRTSAIEFAKNLTINAPNFLGLFVNAFLNILLVLVMSFYLTLDGKRIRDMIMTVVAKRYLSGVLLFEDALNRVVGNYIRGQLLLALIIGIATAIVCWITGLGQFALICGLLAFLFETIPMIGPGLASITPLALSLLLPEPFPRTFWIIIAFVVIQIVESNILGPRVVGHAVGLHPVAAILALLVGARIFGIFGALLATPIVAAGWVVIASFYRSAKGETADQILAKKRAPWTIPRPGRLRSSSGELVNPDDDDEHSREVDSLDQQDVVEHAQSLEDQRQEREKDEKTSSPG